MVSPPPNMSISSSLEPVNITLFGKRVLACQEIIMDYPGRHKFQWQVVLQERDAQRKRYTQRRRRYKDGGREWSGVAWQPPKTEKCKEEFLPGASQGRGPCQLLISDFWSTELWGNTFQSFKATQFVVMCCSCHKKLVQLVIKMHMTSRRLVFHHHDMIMTEQFFLHIFFKLSLVRYKLCTKHTLILHVLSFDNCIHQYKHCYDKETENISIISKWFYLNNLLFPANPHILPMALSNHWSVFYHYRLNLSFQEFQINGMIQHYFVSSFCYSTFFRFIHGVAYITSCSVFFGAEQYFTEWMP